MQRTAWDTLMIASPVKRLFTAGASLALVLCLAACSRGDDANLWKRSFKAPSGSPAGAPGNDVLGYWQGEVAMGNVRAKIENARITLAIRCDADGKIVAQGSAPIAIQSAAPAKIVLQTDLLSDGGDVCGFRFNKGNEFAYSFGQPGVLKINFAGTSVSELSKVANLEPG